ncbi:kinase-like protein [Athelia psychrophila]|uniref:Kinase-like protein n=1 Tax=Athelia psychrophila TaxID=1759441 RepID=A0A167V5R8_9AGAM|nr:kinase-like protein [Fibularhizoctonia sp. CBS 109695]
MFDSQVAVKVLQSHVYDHELEGKIEKVLLNAWKCTSIFEEGADGSGYAQRIRREISIWQRLKHENVLPLLGTVQHFGRYISLVSPWMENGSLVQYLKECGGDMGMLRRLQLASEVASGLSYLHSSGVVHGDLSGMNVLITEEGKACLCDFGLSSLMLEFHDPTFCTSTIGANARWAAPEIYRISSEDQDSVPIATTKSDVYSFGCILLEILSGLIPYHYLARDGQVLLELQNGTKPRRPQGEGGYVTDALWAQITACWAEPAEQRPTAPQLVEFLQDQYNLERRLQRHLG